MQLANYHTRGRDTRQPCVKAVRRALGRTGTVYIVGKGPSLDSLTEADFAEFPTAPILCVNESVHAVEKLDIPAERLFCVQHDHLRGDNSPARAKWLLASHAYKGQPGAIRFDLKAVAPHAPNLTAATALSIASLAGATQAVMLAFDAAFDGDCAYAGSIGHTPDLPGQNPRRFVHFAARGIPRRAEEEGMRLIWQAPKDFWLIALVLRSGGEYGMKHVNSIIIQIDSHLQTPHGFVLLTDDPKATAWRTIPLSTGWPGWFAKLELFRPGLPLRGGALFTDLDNFFGRGFQLPNWDSLEPGRLYMPPDPYRDMRASMLMAWRMGTVTAPYRRFLRRPVTRCPGNPVFSDQEIINAAMKDKISDLDLLTFASWKKDHPAPADVDCVVFHGKPKPWDVGLVDDRPVFENPPPPARNWHSPRERAAEFLRQHPEFVKRNQRP